MFRTSKLNFFIGDDLNIRVVSKDGLVDFADYAIASELRTNGGDGAIAATFSIVKDAPNGFGRVLGFTASLPRTVTALLLPEISYAIDYKLSLGGAVQHSERVLVRFEKVVTA